MAKIVKARQLESQTAANDNPLPRKRLLARLGWAVVAAVVVAAVAEVFLG